MTDKTLKSHVKKCGDLKAKIDTLTALYDTEKNFIKDALKERNTTDFQGGGYTVKICEFTQNKFNSTALKAANPDIYNHYLTVSNMTRFTVKALRG